MGAAKRSLYVALRHAQIAVDIVSEGDCEAGALNHYTTLFIVEPQGAEAPMQAIASWVEGGGNLVLTAAAAVTRLLLDLGLLLWQKQCQQWQRGRVALSMDLLSIQLASLPKRTSVEPGSPFSSQFTSQVTSPCNTDSDDPVAPTPNLPRPKAKPKTKPRGGLKKAIYDL